jgi:hypothetical protein
VRLRAYASAMPDPPVGDARRWRAIAEGGSTFGDRALSC